MLEQSSLGNSWASWQAEEGEANAETGTHVGQEAWTSGEAEPGLKTGGRV